MIYLSGTYRTSLPEEIGLMVTPMMSARHPVGRTWAADTGCFLRPDAYTDRGYLEFLQRRVHLRDRCLFATAPDVVGNAAATLERSRPMLDPIRRMGYRVALVAQNGLVPEAVPWEEIDAVFLGGVAEVDRYGMEREWKESAIAHELAQEARRRGKWIHMGRMNSYQRMRIAHQMGCDSADGTHIVFKPDVRTKEIESWLMRLDAQQTLWGKN